MILLDTNILIYAVGRDHPLRAPCARIIAAISDGTMRCSTTVEVIQEFLHARARTRGRDQAVVEARDYSTLLEPLIVLDSNDLRAGLRLFERVPALDAFDAVLAAAALARDAEALVSSDAAFGDVPRLRHIDPATAGFGELLSEA